MKNQNGNGINTSTNQSKKTYRPPILLRYGMISEITAGGSGNYGDPGTSVGKRPSPQPPYPG